MLDAKLKAKAEAFALLRGYAMLGIKPGAHSATIRRLRRMHSMVLLDLGLLICEILDDLKVLDNFEACDGLEVFDGLEALDGLKAFDGFEAGDGLKSA